MKPVKIIVIALLILAAASVAVFSRRDNSDTVSGTWKWEDGDEIWTFSGNGNFTRTWSDSFGDHTMTGHYRIENGADLFLTGEDENGVPFSANYYFYFYKNVEMKLSSRWYKRIK